MNKFEKDETLKWLERMHKKFGQEIAIERKNGARLRFEEIIDDIIHVIKDIPAAEGCNECKDCKCLGTERRPDGGRVCTKFDRLISDEEKRWCLYGEKRVSGDVVEQCPECGNEVWLKWDVARDGYTTHCPYCGYRMKLCSMCDVRDGGKCDWNSVTGECKNDTTGRYDKAHG